MESARVSQLLRAFFRVFLFGFRESGRSNGRLGRAIGRRGRQHNECTRVQRRCSQSKAGRWLMRRLRFRIECGETE